MELQSLPFVRASHTVTRDEKGTRPTPPTFNEANTGSDPAVCSRDAITNSNSGPSSMFAPVVTESAWTTSVCVCRAVPSGSVEGPRHTALSSVQVLPRPSQLKTRGKARSRKRGFEGTPAIVDHLAQLRRKEQGFSTGYFGAPCKETSSYDDPTFGGSTSEKDLQTVPSSPNLKRLCHSADEPWQGVRQHRHTPSNSVVEPSLQLSLEDVAQRDNNWALFSAPQEGIKWESGDPFLQTCAEGNKQQPQVVSSCPPVSGLHEETFPHSSFTSVGAPTAWKHSRCEGPSLVPVSFGALPVPHMVEEEVEGECALQPQSFNTTQASMWLYDCDSGGGEEGSGIVGIGGAHSTGASSNNYLFSVPLVLPEGEDDHVFVTHSRHTPSSSTRHHRHWGCNQEESPLIPWEE